MKLDHNVPVPRMLNVPDFVGKALTTSQYSGKLGLMRDPIFLSTWQACYNPVLRVELRFTLPRGTL